MKKLLSLMLALLITTGITFAQNTDKNAKPAKPATEMKGKMKKDGTPDMRYKENKDATKKEAVDKGTKMKKDGTPDMRYKENKEVKKEMKKETKK
ncbi:MAG: hypothetical protein BGO70_18320 [Bacteroidetes bacterium 43-93]|nr:hypothetical protein [Bacteroidota bacterium]OJX01687.1 MAG: hypothetical protein BGO70_18320 [Bacteroidetes bacterium 43-93]